MAVVVLALSVDVVSKCENVQRPIPELNCPLGIGVMRALR